MRSKSPFLSKTPLKNLGASGMMMKAGAHTTGSKGPKFKPPIGTLVGGKGVGEEAQVLGNLDTASSTNLDPYTGMMEGIPPSSRDQTGGYQAPRPTGNTGIAGGILPTSVNKDPNAFQGETDTQQRISEQMRASNDARMAAGGTRGQSSDAGYFDQVNAVTGLSPDRYDDEILMSNESMGDVVDVTGQTMGGKGKTYDGSNPNNEVIGDKKENALLGGSNDSWVNDTGAVSMGDEKDMLKGDAKLPEIGQESNVQSNIELGGAIPVDPVAETAAPMPNGAAPIEEKLKESICDSGNYQGDGILYDGM